MVVIALIGYVIFMLVMISIIIFSYYQSDKLSNEREEYLKRYREKRGEEKEEKDGGIK